MFCAYLGVVFNMANSREFDIIISNHLVGIFQKQRILGVCMKKFVICVCIAMSFLLTACVSQSDYDLIEEKVAMLESEYQQLSKDYSSLSEEQAELDSALTDFSLEQQEKNLDYDAMWNAFLEVTAIPEEAYTTYGSENGLSGCGWLLEGDITEISTYNSLQYIVVENDVGDFAVGEIPLYMMFPVDWQAGDHILVNIVYSGYSDAIDLPVGYYNGFYVSSR
jgi:outer membrane murein-binding lipoprotein Lpp